MLHDLHQEVWEQKEKQLHLQQLLQQATAGAATAGPALAAGAPSCAARELLSTEQLQNELRDACTRGDVDRVGSLVAVGADYHAKAEVGR